MRSLLPLVAAAAALFPSCAAGQLVLRDDVNGWGWLTMIEGRRAVAQLSYGNPQTGVQGRLDAQLLDDLLQRGVGRVFDAGTFDAAVSQVLAECTATDRTEAGSPDITFAMHAEVSYWDHTRLAATEIYESLRIAAVPQQEFRPGTYVEACSSAVADVLLRLGFTEG
ncbi:MAG TPA: hypothetical protein VMM35_00615 [Longimicrobiales bacterium]|nr:hypothetical protein [Longimicrobiales bacterium]